MNNKYFIIFFLFCSLCFSKEEIFIKEYTYRASERESEQEARENAKTMAIKEQLELISLNIKSEIRSNIKEVDGDISEIFEQYTQSSAGGQVRTEIIDSSWDGKNYWIKLKIYADPVKIAEDLKETAEAISDARKIHSDAHLDAMKLAATHKEFNQYCIAQAIITDNLAVRLLANFYAKTLKRNKNVRMVKNKNEALNWLKSNYENFQLV